MRKMLAVSLFAGLGISAVHAADAPQCQKVRISDLGWTDIMLTNSTAEVLLDAVGYDATQTLLGLDVTFVSLKNNEMDVFLGNWLPAQTNQYKPYFDDGSVEVLGTNLEGAKVTLAVPKYVSDAGIKSFDDLAAHADKFDKKIFTIEPGSNQMLLDMVAANRHGLGDWEIVESSEAGMLSQVRKYLPEKYWIVFLGWEPHPMNLDYEITYLAGGDIEYGPNFGGSSVRTIARKGFKAECPNVAKFFANLVFDLEYENRGMQLVIGEEKDPSVAAREMMTRSPEKLTKWLDGVTTFDGKPALPVVKAALAKCSALREPEEIAAMLASVAARWSPVRPSPSTAIPKFSTWKVDVDQRRMANLRSIPRPAGREHFVASGRGGALLDRLLRPFRASAEAGRRPGRKLEDR